MAVAIPKICGIETEYGIVVKGANINPIAASSVLINAYLVELGHHQGRADLRVGWDFDDEHPSNDARGDVYGFEAFAPEIESHLVNSVITNGARYYVDHAHPEYSSPECGDAHEALLYDKAGERILLASMRAAAQQLPAGQEVVVYKNNSDGKGNSYGCHENYLMDRNVPFGRIVHQATAHFVTRQIYTGAGKVGGENGVRLPADDPFQLTQRADFFEAEVGLETTLKRPIINTRDEPHCDPKRFRRLHVIVGDANMCEVATFLKLGVTSIILSMIEDGAYPAELELASPVAAMRHVSHDTSLRRPIQLDNKSWISALDLQWRLFEAASKFAISHGMASVGVEVGEHIMRRWEQVLTGLESDPMQLKGQIDWVAKLALFEAFRERHRLPWNAVQLKALDLQYHDIRPERSIFDRLGTEQLLTADSIDHAVEHPPESTRAYFRGRCVAKYPANIVAANWDSIMFDTGGDNLRRVPLMDPMRGTAQHVGRLIDTSDTAVDLLNALEGHDTKE